MIPGVFAAKLLGPVVGRWVVLALLVAGVGGFGYVKGIQRVEREWEVARIKAENERLKEVDRLAKVTGRVVYETVDRWHVVTEKGKTIVKEVPKYVTVESDKQCVVTRGFERVHDAAASNLPMSAPAPGVDETPAGIEISEVAGRVAENYLTCHQIRTQCEGLMKAWSAVSGQTR